MQVWKRHDSVSPHVDPACQHDCLRACRPTPGSFAPVLVQAHAQLRTTSEPLASLLYAMVQAVVHRRFLRQREAFAFADGRNLSAWGLGLADRVPADSPSASVTISSGGPPPMGAVGRRTEPA